MDDMRVLDTREQELEVKEKALNHKKGDLNKILKKLEDNQD